MHHSPRLAVLLGALLGGCSTTNMQPASLLLGPPRAPFSVYPDRVLEGSRRAIALSPRALVVSGGGPTRRWDLARELNQLPTLEAPQFPLLAALYNMALQELLEDIRPDRTFMAGAQWSGVWTRDISFSIHLSLALLLPEVAERSLRAKVNALPEVIQDTGTGGSWPISTDRVVWALAAWELYLATSKRAWLTYAYDVLKNTARRDRHVAFEPITGLYRGESSFLDWREQTYPPWMESIDIFEAKALGTNVLHQRMLAILQRMSEELARPADEVQAWRAQAAALHQTINQQLWSEQQGHYAALLYPEPYGMRDELAESLGEALAVLFEVATGERAARVIARAPVVPYGVPCIFPQQPAPPPYHNRAVWPFVEAYFAWASSRVGNHRAVEHALFSMVRAAALFLTHKENFVAESGQSQGTAINSDRQLWSVAGYLALVYRVLFGISLETDGLHVRPAVPASVPTPLVLRRFPYAQGHLDLTLRGHGGTIRRLLFDGVARSPSFRVPPRLRGHHQLEIELEGAGDDGEINLQSAAHVVPPEPRGELAREGSQAVLRWPSDAGLHYRVYRNGKLERETAASEARVSVDAAGLGVYMLRARDGTGQLSRPSRPLWVFSEGPLQLDAAEAAAPLSVEHAIAGYSGRGYVRSRLSPAASPAPLRFAVQIERAGTYLLRARYANGSGPINTDNKCALRGLRVDGREVGTMVLPQRGTWSAWGHSNALPVALSAGPHALELFYDEGDRNMNGEVNEALVDQLELIRLR